MHNRQIEIYIYTYTCAYTYRLHEALDHLLSVRVRAHLVVVEALPAAVPICVCVYVCIC